MSELPKITFQKLAEPKKGVAVLLAGAGLALGPTGRALDEASSGAISRAARAAEFTGKPKSSLDLYAPAGLDLDRVIVIGVGDAAAMSSQDWFLLGGSVSGKLSNNIATATVVLELDAGDLPDAAAAAEFAAGAKLAAYKFDRYKTKKKDDEKPDAPPRRLVIAVADHTAARKAFSDLDAITDGTLLARDLVNEPANVLGPEEFAARAKELEKLDVDVKILAEKDMQKLGMNALLAVGQGSERPSRLVIMRWNGLGKSSKKKPVVFVGKGVVFDTGGISIKPAAGMEDMKGDMGGAACVTGLMHALAARKAKVNAVGVIGLVENMPDGRAQRPGDIVTSMSGQTIEVINTDAEGRLVLCDALTYVQQKFKPAFIVDLATLTGAIIVALGNHYAGMFSNDDELANRLSAAGQETGEKVWRMPLGKEYDKLIDSKFADMKNVGGRWGGAITAAQFLKRFVEDDVPWAHLDVAGTAMGSPSSEVNKSWGSGFGVRLLDRLVAEHYEGR
ncbi:leucyl aminopeptidase [Microbaculum marinum]|uniref:Probable cytosol aminopeptidase n=1 Tax=Microbaculum marinum TaxID=1764581 RepID=A0AAW9RZQ0_9HYPH